MSVMKLVDVSDHYNACGILLCENANMSHDMLQDKVDEIKNAFESEDLDWFVDDVISKIPNEWNVKYYADNSTAMICI